MPSLSNHNRVATVSNLSSSGWRIDNSDLKPFQSLFFPLDTARHIIIYNQSASMVARRVCEFARRQSLVFRIDINAPCTCTLVSDDFLVTLQITLWKLSSADLESVHYDGDSKTKKDGILVQVSKREGDSFQFHHLESLLRKILIMQKLKFSNAKHDLLTSASKGIAVLHLPPKLGGDNCATNLLTKKESDDIFKSASVVCDMIGNERSNYTILSGMRMLNGLTDCLKVYPAHAARHMGKIILTGSDQNGCKLMLRDVLIENIIQKKNSMAHYWAVRIVGNAFDSYLVKEVDDDARRQEDNGFDDCWEKIMSVLIKDMENVEEDAHTARIAARCLNKMLIPRKKRRSLVEETSDQNKIRLIVRNLLAYGENKHEKLKKEAVILLYNIIPTIEKIESSLVHEYKSDCYKYLKSTVTDEFRRRLASGF